MGGVQGGYPPLLLLCTAFPITCGPNSSASLRVWATGLIIANEPMAQRPVQGNDNDLMTFVG